MKEQNGSAKLPSIKINWDENTQTVGLVFEPQEFKRWEFVLALLEMAKLKCQESMRLVQTMQLQQQLMQQEQAQQIASSLGAKSLELGRR